MAIFWIFENLFSRRIFLEFCPGARNMIYFWDLHIRICIPEMFWEPFKKRQIFLIHPSINILANFWLFSKLNERHVLKNLCKSWIRSHFFGNSYHFSRIFRWNNAFFVIKKIIFTYLTCPAGIWTIKPSLIISPHFPGYIILPHL